MIVLFTDFGLAGPYVGQLHLALLRDAPGVTVIDLMHDVPAFDAKGAAYLLAALAPGIPDGAVVVAVVDPGVGGERRGAIVKADGRWFVGPDNGLLSMVAQRAEQLEWWDITYQPPQLSASFHGRDIFAPVAALLAQGDGLPGDPVDPAQRLRLDWPAELAQVIYIDGFGNVVTGIRAEGLGSDAKLMAAGSSLARARTFCEVPAGEGFWYENSNGLAEISVNCGAASRLFGLAPGMDVAVQAD